MGGDGGTSYGGMSMRNRKAMLAAIEYEASKPHDNEDFDLQFGQEDLFFLSRLKEMHKNTGAIFKIATRAETIAFGAGESQVIFFSRIFLVLVVIMLYFFRY